MITCRLCCAKSHCRTFLNCFVATSVTLVVALYVPFIIPDSNSADETIPRMDLKAINHFLTTDNSSKSLLRQ